LKLWLVLTFILSGSLWGQGHNPSFILKLSDSGISVSSPEKKMKLFSVIIENKSLSDQVAKFVSGTDNLKFVTIEAGKSQTIEIENKGTQPVFFVPMSPSFQEVELKFGKKTYEVPPKR